MKSRDFSNKITLKIILVILGWHLLFVAIFFFFRLVQIRIDDTAPAIHFFKEFLIVFLIPLCFSSVSLFNEMRNKYVLSGDVLYVKEYHLFTIKSDVSIPLRHISDVRFKSSFFWLGKHILITVGEDDFDLHCVNHRKDLYEVLKSYKELISTTNESL